VFQSLLPAGSRKNPRGPGYRRGRSFANKWSGSAAVTKTPGNLCVSQAACAIARVISPPAEAFQSRERNCRHRLRCRFRERSRPASQLGSRCCRRCHRTATDLRSSLGRSRIPPGRCRSRPGDDLQELIRLDFVCNDHLVHLAALAKRYKDRKPDLADLCLIRMSELHPKHSVITVDEDFRVYRRNKRGVIPLISPPGR
jgi:hypothetical protein